MFKFNWFSSKERKDYERLKTEELALNEDLKSIVTELKIKPELPLRPFKNLYHSDGNLTIVFNDGSVLTKTDITQDLFDSIKYAATEVDIIKLLTPEPEVLISNVVIETKDERNLVSANLDILKDNSDFRIEGKKVYFTGVDLELPAIVVASFIEILEKLDVVNIQGTTDEFLNEQYIALKMFWLKLALNGIEQSREDLLNFCRKNDVRITINGNLVLYRRIVTLGDKNKTLVEFISQQYYKIKKWKKSPKNFYVHDNDGEFSIQDEKYHRLNSDKSRGNLHDLYLDLPNMEANEFTSYHNKGKHIIRIGELYQIDESGINLNNGLCAAGGLHAAAVDYNYSSFGDTPVVVLVNPSKAITVPTGETGKLRTTEMFIAAINDKPHGEHFDEDAISYFDEEYNNITVEELEEALKNKSFKPASVEDEISPITFKDMESIKDLLKVRVKNI